MRVCFLTNTTDEKSGWGRYSRAIIQKMKERGIDCAVFVEAASDAQEKPLLNKSLQSVFFLFLSALKIRKRLKNCDIIHCLDGYPYGVIGTLANVGLKKKLIINGVGTYSVAPLYQRRTSLLLKWAYRRADKILCISHYTLNEIQKKMPGLNNLEFVPLGVDLKKFSNLAGNGVFNRIKRNFKEAQKDDKIIMSVGALKSRKGYHISIPAVAEVIKEMPNIKYYIIGDQSSKSYFEKLKQIIRKNNIEEHVFFLQNISDEDLIQYYYDADLFLLTPVNADHHFEGFGLVYLEASACGMPVIGTLNCGAEDAVQNGMTGILVPQSDIEKTAEAIKKIFKDPFLAKQLGENGKKYAAEMSWDKTVDKILKAYSNGMAR